VDPFFRFASHPNLLYTLTSVVPGSANTNCATVLNTGESCSISIDGTTSPVVLTKQGDATLVSIGFLGTATDGNGTSNWSGAFSATIPTITPRAIELLFCPDGSCSASDVEEGTNLEVKSVSGSFEATTGPGPVPEPGTISLFLGGAGFVVIGLVRRRRSTKSI